MEQQHKTNELLPKLYLENGNLNMSRVENVIYYTLLFLILPLARSYSILLFSNFLFLLCIFFFLTEKDAEVHTNTQIQRKCVSKYLLWYFVVLSVV